MKMEDIRSLSNEKLLAQLETLRKEQLNLKFQQAAGQLEKPHRVAEVKKDIARVKTELTARKNNQEGANNA
jgi:large subunit ribosomal protein L29